MATRYSGCDLNNMARYYVKKLGRMVSWDIILNGRTATLQILYRPKGQTTMTEIFNVAI